MATAFHRRYLEAHRSSKRVDQFLAASAPRCPRKSASAKYSLENFPAIRWNNLPRTSLCSDVPLAVCYRACLMTPVESPDHPSLFSRLRPLALGLFAGLLAGVVMLVFMAFFAVVLLRRHANGDDLRPRVSFHDGGFLHRRAGQVRELLRAQAQRNLRRLDRTTRGRWSRRGSSTQGSSVGAPSRNSRPRHDP